MKLIILAFILSLSLHFILFSPFEKKENPKNSASSSKENKKSSVQYVRLMPKATTKQKDKKESKKEIIKKAKKTIPMPIKKVEVRPTPTKEFQ